MQIASLLRQIVELDYWRILSRLRSRHAKKTQKVRNKPAMPILLAKAVKEAQSIVEPVSRQRFEELKVTTEALAVCFNELETTTIRKTQYEALIHILDFANKITCTYNDLASLLHFQTVDPTTMTYLPEALRKLARYVNIAEYLTAAARGMQYGIFGNISVEVLKPPFVPKLILPQRRGTLDEAWGNFRNRKQGAPSQAQMIASLKARNHHSLAQTRFAQTVLAMQRPSIYGKVHAEIQLLFFYQLNPGVPQPRWICASKSACYLCHTFVHCHGGYQVPRTHGRVYETWVLPELLKLNLVHKTSRFSGAIGRMNKQLEHDILVFIEQETPLFLQPNESVVPERLYVSPTSTIMSTKPQPAVHEKRLQTTDSLVFEQGSDTSSSNATISNATSLEEVSLESQNVSHSLVEHDTEGGLQSSKSDSSIGTILAETEMLTATYYLVRGEKLHKRLFESSRNIVVVVGKLKLYVGSPVPSITSHDTTALNDWVVNICWLEEPFSPTTMSSDFEILDVAQMTSSENIGQAGAAFSDKVLIIRKKNTYVSLKFSLAQMQP